MSLFGGGSSGSAPKAPPFTPANIPNIANRALTQDLTRYADLGFPAFPGMTALLNNEIQDAYNQLTQPLSPDFQRQFMNTATVTGQSVTGGGDLYSGMQYKSGSFGQGAVSSNVTRQTLAKQDYDRSRFESLISGNPIPGLGLSQNDLLSMYVYNTGAANASTMQNFAQQTAFANQQYANSQQEWSAIGNLIAGLGRTYYNYNMNQQFGGYGSGMTPSGNYIG